MRTSYKIFFIIIFVVFTQLINKYCVHSKDPDPEYYNRILRRNFRLYVSYKNDGRMYGLYMSKTLEDVEKIKKKNIKPGEPYGVPRYPDIEFSVYATLPLFYKANIGDEIQKLPNTNKCYLFREDSIYRYNCYHISEIDRKSLIVVEWDPNELGFWKVVPKEKIMSLSNLLMSP